MVSSRGIRLEIPKESFIIIFILQWVRVEFSCCGGGGACLRVFDCVFFFCFFFFGCYFVALVLDFRCLASALTYE